jgi:hypothetical protein
LNDKAFSTFLDRNPPFEPQPKNLVSPIDKSPFRQWPVIDTKTHFTEE